MLQLDDAQRQPVDEQHDVRPAFVLVLDDRELVHREPVVGLRFVEVEDADLVATNPAVRVDVLHRHAGHDQPMEVAVAGLQRRPGRACQSAQHVVECVGGKVGIELGECGPQAPVQHDLAVIGAFRVRRVGRDVRAVGDLPTDPFKPSEGGVFNCGFRQERIAHEVDFSRVTTRTSRSISRAPARRRK